MAQGELLYGTSGALIYGTSGTLLYSTSGGTRADSVCFDYARYSSGVLRETVTDCLDQSELPIYYFTSDGSAQILPSLSPMYRTHTSSVFIYKDGQTTRPDIAPTGITVEIYQATSSQGEGTLLDTITYPPAQASRTIGGVTYNGWSVAIPSASTLHATYGDFRTKMTVNF
jgi:hypothetical protein